MNDTYDYIIVGSGFGGSVSAMRLTEKGYRVLVLEQGKRFRDEDFARSTWDVRKYLWLPAVRCFGVMQISLFQHVLVMHGAGVGGGSLGYASVLMGPGDALFDAPAWKQLADWKSVLRPHYATARRMLGVSRNARQWPADKALQHIAGELGQADTFALAPVGVYFGQPGQDGQPRPDPYFGGQGPERQACTHCGACMLGCRHNAKNTLVKNYLYLAEKWGARVQAEARVSDVRPLPPGQPDGARYEVIYTSPAAWRPTRPERVRARNVLLAGGTLGTLGLLFRCRDISRSLPRLSACLGERVLTNSESLLGVVNPGTAVDYSAGIAITSSFMADGETTIQPVRYPAGSDLMRLLAGPLVEAAGRLARLGAALRQALTRPADFISSHIQPGWARRTTILLVMQTVDSHLRLRLGRHALTGWRRGLVSQAPSGRGLPAYSAIGHAVARRLGALTGGVAAGTLNESLFNVPTTAHLLGGCPFGRDEHEGVIGLDCQVHNYPGLFVVDGSIMPANPGVNPSLTIAALAEYAMAQVPAVEGRERAPLFAGEVG